MSSPKQAETPTERAERLGCYCMIWDKNPNQYLKRSIPAGYCGFCNVCGEPGHIRHFPGSAPYTACWCERHYKRLLYLHPSGFYGCYLYLALFVLLLLAAIGLIFWFFIL